VLNAHEAMVLLRLGHAREDRTGFEDVIILDHGGDENLIHLAMVSEIFLTGIRSLKDCNYLVAFWVGGTVNPKSEDSSDY